MGGYVAASGLAALLVPLFSWRILWFLNLPTGLILIFLNILVPESPKFLLSIGRVAEAHAVMRGFGCTVCDAGAALQQEAQRMASVAAAASADTAAAMHRYAGTTWALSITAIAWGFINFGLLLWMPAHLVAKGYSMALSSQLLAASVLIALPTVFVAAFLYSRWSAKGALLGAIALAAAGLLGVIQLELGTPGATTPVWSIAVLIVGINGMIAMLLPYAAESYPLRFRGRATGWVAACTKGGGLGAQLLSLVGLVPSLGVAAAMILAPVAVSLVLVWRFCGQTRGGI